MDGIQLAIPVLQPIAYCDRTIIFPLGDDRGDIRCFELLKADITQIETIVSSFGLSTLGHRGRMRIIDIGDNRYLTDPVDDSASEVGNYIDPRK